MLNVLLWGPPSGQGVQTAVCVQSELWSVFVRHCYNQRAQHHCYHQRSVAAGCVFYAKAVLRFWTNIQVFYNLGCVLFIYFFLVGPGTVGSGAALDAFSAELVLDPQRVN